MEKMHKTTFAEKLGYGLGELPGTMNAILGAVLTMFYTDSVGLAAGMRAVFPAADDGVFTNTNGTPSEISSL